MVGVVCFCCLVILGLDVAVAAASMLQNMREDAVKLLLLLL